MTEPIPLLPKSLIFLVTSPIKEYYTNALRMAKTLYSFGHSECNRVKDSKRRGRGSISNMLCLMCNGSSTPMPLWPQGDRKFTFYLFKPQYQIIGLTSVHIFFDNFTTPNLHADSTETSDSFIFEIKCNHKNLIGTLSKTERTGQACLYFFFQTYNLTIFC